MRAIYAQKVDRWLGLRQNDGNLALPEAQEDFPTARDTRRPPDNFRAQFANRTFQSRIENALRGVLDEESTRQLVADLIDRRLDEMTPKMVKDIVQQMIHKHQPHQKIE